MIDVLLLAVFWLVVGAVAVLTVGLCVVFWGSLQYHEAEDMLEANRRDEFPTDHVKVPPLIDLPLDVDDE